MTDASEYARWESRYRVPDCAFGTGCVRTRSSEPKA
jgi:hypothetical protein